VKRKKSGVSAVDEAKGTKVVKEDKRENKLSSQGNAFHNLSKKEKLAHA